MREQIAMAIGDQRHPGARAVQEAQALLEVSRALSSTLETSEVLQLIVDWAVRVIESAERAVIHLLDDSGQALTPAAVHQAAAPTHSLQMRVGVGIAGQVLAEGRTISVPDAHADPRYLPSEHPGPTRSLLVAPVQVGHLRLGTISVESVQPAAFTSDDERLLTTLGAQAGIALHNANLYAESRRQYREMARLYEVARAFDAISRPTELYGQMAQRIAECFEAEQCVVLLRDEARGRLEAQAPAWGLTEAQLSRLNLPTDELSPLESEWQRAGVFLSNHPQTDPRLNPGIAAALAERSLMIARLVTNTRRLGVLRIANKRSGPFTEEDGRLAAIIAGRAAVALENALLYEALRQTVDQVAASAEELEKANALISNFSVRLADVLRISFAEHPDLGTLVREVLHSTADLLGVDTALVTRIEGNEYVAEYVYDSSGNVAVGQRWPAAPATAMDGPATASPNREHASRVARRPTSLTRAVGLTASLSAPLVVGGRVYGWLVAGWRREHDSHEFDVELIGLLAQHLAHEIWKDWSERELRALNSELAIQREIALSASRLKSEFLANTSHELRTPLNSIIGYLQLVDAGLCESPEEERRYLHAALESSHHLLTVINDVLDIAKVEAGKMELQLEPTSLAETFEDVRTLTHLQAEAKNLSLVFEPPDGLTVMADRGRLRQVLVNLIGNGIKFTERGQVEVWASKYGRMALVAVSDTGVGVAPEAQTRLFGKFVQADSSLARPHDGVGLGLAISRSLVTMMGGEIGLHSEGLGRGTLVWFTLPLT